MENNGTAMDPAPAHDDVHEIDGAEFPVSYRPKNYDTLFRRACEAGDIATVRFFLKHGSADVNMSDRYGDTPLHMAAVQGAVDVVEALNRAQANPNATTWSGRTPLHAACGRHHSDVLRVLLASGADLWLHDNDGHLPLHLCIEARTFKHFTEETLKTLYVLASFRTEWDMTCDDMVANGKAWRQAPALRVCFGVWKKEYDAGRHLTTIELEILERGPAATKMYMDAIQMLSKATATSQEPGGSQSQVADGPNAIP